MTGKNPDFTADDDEPPPDPTRLDLHAFLGELHGLLFTLRQEIGRWCPEELQEPLGMAVDETHPMFGRANAALSTGSHDEALPVIGLTGKSLAMKLGVFRRRLAEFYRVALSKKEGLVKSVKEVVRWALVPLETLAGVLPGGTAIKEIFLAINEAAVTRLG